MLANRVEPHRPVWKMKPSGALAVIPGGGEKELDRGGRPPRSRMFPAPPLDGLVQERLPVRCTFEVEQLYLPLRQIHRDRNHPGHRFGGTPRFHTAHYHAGAAQLSDVRADGVPHFTGVLPVALAQDAEILQFAFVQFVLGQGRLRIRENKRGERRLPNAAPDNLVNQRTTFFVSSHGILLIVSGCIERR